MMRATLIAGDTLNFKTSVPQYLPRAGWTLTYKLIPRAAGAVITFDATAEFDQYLVQVGPSVTANWVAGEYSWIAYVGKTGERYTVDRGNVTIEANPATAATYDNRSHARRTLEAIEAVIERRATVDQMAYTIGTRQLSRMPIRDLISFRNQYRAEVYGEEQRDAAQVGQDTGRVVVRL